VRIATTRRARPGCRFPVGILHGTSGARGEAGKIGAGAGVGAIIGGGGTVAATTGKDVELQPGTALRMTRYLLLPTSFIAPFAAAIVFSTSRSVCAPERNHASNCDGGG